MKKENSTSGRQGAKKAGPKPKYDPEKILDVLPEFAEMPVKTSEVKKLLTGKYS
jgi:hypothetical protein